MRKIHEKSEERGAGVSKKKLIIILLCVAILLGGGIWALASPGGGVQLPLTPVTTVGRATLESSVTAQGEVFLLESEVASITNTLEILEILVRENDVVEQGEPLMVFNTQTIERTRERERLVNQLQDTQLSLRSQELHLESLRMNPSQMDIESAILNIHRIQQSILNVQLIINQVAANVNIEPVLVSQVQGNLTSAYNSLTNTEAFLRNSPVTLNQLDNASRAMQNIEAEARNAGERVMALDQIYNSRNELERGLVLLENSLFDANLALSNTRTLFNAGAATQNQVDNAVRAVENLETEIANANTRLLNLNDQWEQNFQAFITSQGNVLLAGFTLDDLPNRIYNPQNLNSIAQQEINIQRTRLAVQDITRIITIFDDVEEVLYSPISGTVTRINATVGGFATPGTPLVEISDAGAYILRAFVNERNAAGLRVGQSVEIEGSILGNEILSGVISSVSTVATTTIIAGISERVIPIEIRVTQPTDLLIPGVTVDVTITLDVRENVVAIPMLATLSQPGGGDFVFVLGDDNILEQRFVELWTFADMMVEVTGLEEGEHIVLQPLATMYDGMVIEPLFDDEDEENEEDEYEEA